MLVGSISYDYGGKKFRYSVKGSDTSVSMMLKITSKNYDAICFLEDEDYEKVSDTLWERRYDVGLTNIKVETPIKTVNGKSIKNEVNSNFFCRVGALIRYAKMNCVFKNQLGYTGLQIDDGFDTSSQSEYIIKFPCKDEIFANVVLDFGDIVSLKIKTDDVEIFLEDDKSSEMEVFRGITTNGRKIGIKFDSDYLGFEIPQQVVYQVASNNGLYTCIDDVVKAYPSKEFIWLLEKNYIIVSDENLDRICKYIMDHDGYVFYDTETTGLKINFRSRVGQADQLTGIVLSVKDGESFFFPTGMKSIKNLCNGDHWYFMEHYMRPILEKKQIVVHNLAFDWRVAYVYNINANIVHDTMLMASLTIGAEKQNFDIGLKALAKLFLHRDSLELSDFVIDAEWGSSDMNFSDLPYELVRLYACADTDNTRGIFNYMLNNNFLEKYNAKKVYEIELAFSYAVAYQMFYGHHINIKNVNSMKEEIIKAQADYMKQMVEIVGHEFNPNSPKQLQTVMYKELGIPEQISRKTGRVTTDKDTLKKLAEITDAEDNIKYPFCKVLQKYREVEGVRKIIDSFPDVMTEDGYIFSDVWQTGASTGRVSIHDTNYQSYNDPVKKNVVPRHGFYMFDTDYSSIEYRVLGNMVGNERIMKSFEDPDFDYHAYQASHMYGIPYSAVTKTLRKAAKGINFGLPYGMGDESLGLRVYGEATPENTRKAASLRAAYFKGQEDIRDWFEYHRNRGVTEGFTETYFGRRRYYHRQQFSNAAIRRQAGNQVIQGTAADIYKLAVGRVFKRICREGWLGHVLLTGFIHDELLGEVDNSINPGVFLKVLREEFEVKVSNPDGTPWCPLYMGFGYGMSWYEAKSVELPIKLQWEFVEKYGETGFPEWNGDGRAFCDAIPDKLRDFEVRDIQNQLLDKENQGREIKPTLNNQVLGCVKDDSKYYKKGIEEYAEENGWNINGVDDKSSWLFCNKEGILGYLDSRYHIQGLYYEDKDENGDPIYLMEFSPCKDTQDAITQFCKLHETDRDSIDIRDIEEFDVANTGTGNFEYSDDFSDEEEAANTDKLERIKALKVETLGMFVDIEKKEVTLRVVPDNYMKFIQSKVNRVEDGYRVYFKDIDKNQLFVCNAWLKSEDINIIQNMYIRYLRQ